MTLSCWICSDHEQCIYPVCYEQESESRRLREDWDKERAMTQAEIEEEQLELKL